MMTNLKLILQTLILSVIINVNTIAQCTYTTTSGGDYFSASNWVDGLQPPNPIPNGVTVTLSNDMTVSGIIENNGIINGAMLTIEAGGGYGGTGTFNGSMVNNGTVSPGLYTPGTIVNTLAVVAATTTATSITATGATTGGVICHDGGTTVTARGVCYGESPTPDISGPKTTDGSGTGTFVSTLSGLVAGTTYYVRAYATNGVGTSYGQEITFMTTAAPAFTCGDPLVYDGKSYTTATMLDGKCWMTQNLDIGTMITGATGMSNNSTIEKYCYGDNTANCTTYGGLYQWNEMMQYTTTAGAQGICPTGWHLPTDTEWTTLTNALPTPDKGSRLAGNAALWTNGALDGSQNFGTSGFVALPAGFRITDGSFDGQSFSAIFWSSTEFGSSNAWYRLLDSSVTDVFQFSGNKSNGFSVRCVRD
jgi:uncharacterized protein (TIGR02145 family)